MGPSMHGNIVLIYVECGQKRLWIIDNVDPDEKVRRFYVIHLKEVIQPIRGLEHEATNKRRENEVTVGQLIINKVSNKGVFAVWAAVRE